MSPTDKYKHFSVWFRTKLEKQPSLKSSFLTIDEWYECYSSDLTRPLPVSIIGFRRLISRFHGDAIYDSKMVKNRRRKLAFLFQDKDFDLSYRDLRNASYEIGKTARSAVMSTSVSTEISLTQLLPVKDKTCGHGLTLLSNVAEQILVSTNEIEVILEQSPSSSPPQISQLDEHNLHYIALSKELDFLLPNRPNILRPMFPSIRIHNCKSLSEGLKWHLICQYMQNSKGNPDRFTVKEKNKLMKAIIDHESYHNGYTKPVISVRTFVRYISDYGRNVHTDDLSTLFTCRKGQNQVSYITFLERNFPRYVHKLYRYSCRILGIDATVPQLIHCMNSRSRVLHPSCPTRNHLKLSVYHFWNFFYSNGGQLKRPTTKPSLTEDQKKARVEWAISLKKAMKELDEFFYCFLDEKWFYTTSRRKKMKILPQADWENVEESKVLMPKVHSRRHCSKVMYMGVIGHPVYKKDENGKFEYEIVDGVKRKIVLFDGKIMCKRVSNREPQTQLSTHQNFVEENILNHDIKNGEWRDLILDPYHTSVSEALDIIANHYGMDDDISDNLCFTYYTWKMVTKRKRVTSPKSKSKPKRKKSKATTATNPGPLPSSPLPSSDVPQPSNSKILTEPPVKEKRKVPIRITREEIFTLKDRELSMENMEKRSLTLADLLIHVRVEKGTMVEKDCSCDSDYMIENIHHIGKSIREAYKNVVKKDKPIVLFMDNAGGHGRDDVKKDYEEILRRDYKVIVHWQIANSPETNLLDLGAWMALQSVVEKKHRLLSLHKDVLARTVEAAFPCLDDAVLTRIHERWLKVLDLIIEDKGNNNMVEKNRGLKKNPMKEIQEELEVGETEEDLIPIDD